MTLVCIRCGGNSGQHSSEVEKQYAELCDDCYLRSGIRHPLRYNKRGNLGERGSSFLPSQQGRDVR